jgi:hypothetical protein
MCAFCGLLRCVDNAEIEVVIGVWMRSVLLILLGHLAIILLGHLATLFISAVASSLCLPFQHCRLLILRSVEACQHSGLYLSLLECAEGLPGLLLFY